jgi:hypothetical protein
MPPAVHRFEAQHSSQTLEQGLAEYRQAHAGLKRGDELEAPEARQFFRSHDVVHVVYGCGTSMADEAVVKLASLLGTTGGLQVLKGYVHHETLDIYRRLPLLGTLGAIVQSPYLIARTAYRCWRQSRRWPWVQHEPYLHVPLSQLRAEFGITVAHARRRG